MSNEVTIEFTLDELDALNLILTKLQETETIEPKEIDNETNAFIENLLIKIAKAKFQQDIIKEIPKIWYLRILYRNNYNRQFNIFVIN